MKKEELDDILTVKDIKNYLKIGINQTYELIAQEKFKSKKIGRVIRVQKTDFLNWLDSEEEMWA